MSRTDSGWGTGGGGAFFYDAGGLPWPIIIRKFVITCRIMKRSKRRSRICQQERNKCFKMWTRFWWRNWIRSQLA